MRIGERETWYKIVGIESFFVVLLKGEVFEGTKRELFLNVEGKKLNSGWGCAVFGQRQEGREIKECWLVRNKRS